MSKEKRSLDAKEHIKVMQQEFSEEITKSRDGVIWVHDNKLCGLDGYENILTEHLNSIISLGGIIDTKIELRDCSTTEIIYDAADKGYKCCVLDFASYIKIGGGYLSGHLAQEESLCAESNLYNILELCNDIYAEQNEHRNKGLYYNSAICVPGVVFTKETHFGFRTADVITCAAPNRVSALNNRVSDDVCDKVLIERIDFILSVAKLFMNRYGSVTLVLGAFGCGVYVNDPIMVAETFKDMLKTKYKGVFPNVIFAVPDKMSRNYQAFESVFKS